MKAHVSQKKKDTVAEFVDLLDTYPIIGVVNMTNLPTKQLQDMRVKLREKKTVLKMTKKRLMRIAFSQAKKKNIADLQNKFEGMPALIFTEGNPFKLYAELQKTKSRAPAKAGQIAPNDIIVNAGPTSFSPGPIIGQLGKYGIKTGVEAGKLVIKEDAVAAKKGEVIGQDLAEILGRLNIEPMEIGLNLTAVYEDGEILDAEILHIDTDEYFKKFAAAHSESFNLSVFTAYPTSDTINTLLSKAHIDSIALALSQDILTDETVKNILSKAYGQALSLSNKLDPQKEEKKEEPKEEEKKEEENTEKPEEPKEKESDTAVGLGSLFG